MSEVGAAFGLDLGLAKEIFAVGELVVELVVEVVSVGDDQDGGIFDGGLDEFWVEDHGEGFTTALGVQEDAAFSVGVCCGFCGFLFWLSKIINVILV